MWSVILQLSTLTLVIQMDQGTLKNNITLFVVPAVGSSGTKRARSIPNKAILEGGAGVFQPLLYTLPDVPMSLDEVTFQSSRILDPLGAVAAVLFQLVCLTTLSNL